MENDTQSRDIRFALTMQRSWIHAREPRIERVTDPVRLGHVVEYEGRGEDSLSPRTR